LPPIRLKPPPSLRWLLLPSPPGLPLLLVPPPLL